ncbi:CHRNB3 [Acrasis kona]|uniref:CHRNB3 n=1 Tax=Acrasis kona TaxID=1008807 RepID=A0AAW2YGY1_9EUKA
MSEQEGAKPNEDKSSARHIYKLHPTFVVLRSQQLNMSDAMNPREDGAQNESVESRLVPNYSVPCQIITPNNGTFLGTRHELLSRDQPTVLPHTYQQTQDGEEEMTGEEQLRRHVETTQQQQQSLFSGPFLLYRTPEENHKLLRRLTILFAIFAVLDIFVLIYLRFGVFYFPFLNNVRWLDWFAIYSSDYSAAKLSPSRAVVEPIMFVLNLLVNTLGCYGSYKKSIPLVTTFLVLTMLDVVIGMMVFVSLFQFVQIAIQIILLATASAVRSKLLYSWYTTNMY